MIPSAGAKGSPSEVKEMKVGFARLKESHSTSRGIGKTSAMIQLTKMRGGAPVDMGVFEGFRVWIFALGSFFGTDYVPWNIDLLR
jgi:hypothetical protein